jgi:hypothetical protein
LKAERRIISKRCVLQYIPVEIFRASFKFFMGDTLRKKRRGGKRDKTFFSALYCATPLQIIFLNNFENCRSPSKMKPCTMTGPEISKKY